METTGRRDAVARVFALALESAVGAEAIAGVWHPPGDFEPHVDVYLLAPGGDRPWTLVTAGLSWPMLEARRKGQSPRYPIELMLELPAATQKPDAERAASVLQSCAEYPTRHGTVLGPGSMIPLREPILPDTDLCALLFGGPARQGLAAQIEREVPSQPKLLRAALLTGPERRAAQVVPAWSLWNAAVAADPGRARCPPLWPRREGRSDDQSWGLMELHAASKLAAKHSPEAPVALREGLRLLEGCREADTLAHAANALLWVGRAFAGSNRALSAECFVGAGKVARESSAPRAQVLAEVADQALAGDLSRVKLDESNLQIFSTHALDERLAWLGLSRAAGPEPLQLPPAVVGEGAAYEPGPPLDFVIDLKLPEPTRRSALLARFPQAWFAAHGFPELRGRIAGEGRWVSVGTPVAQLPDRLYDQARFVVRLVPRPGGKARSWSAAALEGLVEDVRRAAPELGAAARSDARALVTGLEELAGVREAHARGIEVKLVADGGFDGLAVWEAMRELGLRWGNGDIFHLTAGGAAVFEVITSSAPGYFIPEVLALGCSYADLHFSFVLPRSPDPEAAFETMLAAVQRAQRKLGGTIARFDGAPLDEEAVRAEVHRLAEAMREAGWPPGTPRTLQLF